MRAALRDRETAQTLVSHGSKCRSRGAPRHVNERKKGKLYFTKEELGAKGKLSRAANNVSNELKTKCVEKEAPRDLFAACNDVNAKCALESNAGKWWTLGSRRWRALGGLAFVRYDVEHTIKLIIIVCGKVKRGGVATRQ